MSNKAQLEDFARRVMDLRRKAEDLAEETTGDSGDWLKECRDFLRKAENAADEAVAEARG